MHEITANAVNVSEPIRRHASATPGAPAFVTKHGVLVSYAQMEQDIDAAAWCALQLGLEPGQVVALATGDLYKNLIVALALARIGVAHGPILLSPRLTALALLDRGVQGNGCPRRVDLDEFWARIHADGNNAAAPVALYDGGTAPYMYCPTSGTTRAPKLVAISHAVSLRRSDARAQAFTRVDAGPGMPGTRLACLVSAERSYGFSSALLVLHNGGAVVEPTFVASELPGWFAHAGANVLIAAPIALKKVLDALPAHVPNSLQQIEVAGAAMPAAVFEDVSARLCRNVSMNYGLTECGRVASAPMEVVLGKAGGVGYAYPGVEIRILDEQGTSLPAGEEGLVCIRSDRNASGYLDPKATAGVFRAGWVHTRDRGTLDADGFLCLVGRGEDVINRGGEQIHPQAIEEAMLALGDAEEVAVFPVAYDGGPPKICAAVVPRPTMDADTYHDRCRERLGADAPVLIMHLRELPRNDMGKVLRNELARMAVLTEQQRSPRTRFPQA